MTQDTSSQGKGRPTPKRSEAEAARKKTYKRDAKSLKAHQRDERERARRAMLAGDERYYPLRDQGPVKGWVRQYIDSRFSAGELFVPMAFAILILSLFPVAFIQATVFFIWIGMLFLLVIDSVILSFRLRRAVAAEFPNGETRGAVSYGIMRALQMRRLRVPPVKHKIGGAPREIKVKQARTK